MTDNSRRDLQEKLAHRWLVDTMEVIPITASDLLLHGKSRLAADAMEVANFVITIIES